jgi:hypothetical protein
MTVIRCHECAKEVSDQAPYCPYCGAPFGKKIHSNSPIVGVPTRLQKIQKIAISLAKGGLAIVIGTFIVIVGGIWLTTPSRSSSTPPADTHAVSTPATPESAPTSNALTTTDTEEDHAFKTGVRGQPCSNTLCEPGTKAIVQSDGTGFTFACPTKELTQYTSMTTQLMAMSVMATGGKPVLSPKTGEPVYPDYPDGKPNQSRLLLARLRNDAKVKTFDQALDLCVVFKNKETVVGIDYPTKGTVMWVADENIQKRYWVMKTNLVKK